jgi:hypothetical protein
MPCETAKYAQKYAYFHREVSKTYLLDQLGNRAGRQQFEPLSHMLATTLPSRPRSPSNPLRAFDRLVSIE